MSSLNETNFTHLIWIACKEANDCLFTTARAGRASIVMNSNTSCYTQPSVDEWRKSTKVRLKEVCIGLNFARVEIY